MPLYEYQCDACAHRFELIQKFSDPPAESCPTCGGTVKKLLSSPAIQFKGSGWYITDYARAGKSGEDAKASTSEKGQKGDAAGESKTGSTSESAGEKKTDSKGEGKSGPKPSASTSSSD